jgi:hypothetical protein
LPQTHTDKSWTKAYLSQSHPSEIENQQHFTGQAEGTEIFFIAVERTAMKNQPSPVGEGGIELIMGDVGAERS